MNQQSLLSQLCVTIIALYLTGSLSDWSYANKNKTDVAVKLKVQPYQISAASERAIKRKLLVNGPKDQFGVSRDAFTRWNLSWRWNLKDDGIVDISTIRINADVVILIPFLKNPKLGIVRDWKLYRRALIKHELQHFYFAYKGANALAEEYENLLPQGRLSIQDAHNHAKKALALIRKLDREYDRFTDHGLIEGVRW
jgi:predicted secreted Zn-dependent protease